MNYIEFALYLDWGVIKEKQTYNLFGLPLVIYTQQLKTRIWNL